MNPYPLYFPFYPPFQAPMSMYPLQYPQNQYSFYNNPLHCPHMNNQYNSELHRQTYRTQNIPQYQGGNRDRNQTQEQPTNNPRNNSRNNPRNNPRRVQIPQVEIISRTIDSSNNSVQNIELTPNILNSINNLTDELVSSLQFDLHTNVARRITVHELNEHTTLESHQNTSGEAETCSICRQNLEERQIVRKLRCNHKYHTSCIDRWITTESEQNCNCPMCRLPIAPSI